ncbi:MAG: zinc ribbon domain-containing protein [Lachnospiraceae bacterium]|nr:zinc ribbon domain-containing protein [Lachnospiraceae bacterium]
MKNCPNCNAQLPDDAVFCTACGTSLNGPSPAGNQQNANPNFQQGNYQYQQAPYIQPWDHTAEFDAKDVSDNKVLAMLLYLVGGFAIIYALLGGQKSEYLMFHVRQNLKFLVCETLLAIVAVLLCWTIIVPIAAGICIIILAVVKIICFFQICGNKSVEPAIIRSLTFLK